MKNSTAKDKGVNPVTIYMILNGDTSYNRIFLCEQKIDTEISLSRKYKDNFKEIRMELMGNFNCLVQTLPQFLELSRNEEFPSLTVYVRSDPKPGRDSSVGRASA